jgi:hypothetical protein
LMRKRLPSLILLLVLVGVLGLHNPALLSTSAVVGGIVMPGADQQVRPSLTCKHGETRFSEQKAGDESRDGDDAIPQQNLKYLGRMTFARLRTTRLVKPASLAPTTRPAWVSSQGNILRKRILKKSR